MTMFWISQSVPTLKKNLDKGKEISRTFYTVTLDTTITRILKSRLMKIGYQINSL